MGDKIISTQNLRWGIIGCGNVTEIKSGPAFQNTQGFEVLAVMRRNLAKVKDYANRHRIKKYYTDATELINDKEVEAVYIATPPDSHMKYALATAKAGKICCIEKPMAPSFKECQDIHTAFKQKSIPLFVAYYRRSLPRFEQINHWLKSNQIGKVRYINWVLSKRPNEMDLTKKYNWRTDESIAPGGYFDDLASHGIDLFTYLLGDIKQVSGFSINQQGLYKSKDALVACWLHENDITGTGTWNFGAHDQEDRVEIVGSLGKITFAIFEDKPIELELPNDKKSLHIANPKHVQIHHVENIKKHLVEDNYSHPSTGLTAMHTSWVMDQIIGN